MDLLTQYPILGDLLNLLKNNLLGVFFVVSCLFEFSKVKINPITDAMEFLLKPIRKDVKEMKDDIDDKFESVDKKFDNIDKILEDMQEDNDNDKFATYRWEILTFASAINNGQLFTEQEYQHILDIISKYKYLHDKYQFTNGHTDDAIKKINEHHDEYKNSSAKYY